MEYCCVVLVAKSCPTLCDPMDCSPPGSSVHEIFQARILEWVAISFSRGSSQPRDWTQISCNAGRFFTNWAIREALVEYYSVIKKNERMPSAATWMDQEIITLSEVSWKKTNITWYHLYVESKKKNTNELIYKPEIDSHWKQTYDY